MQTNIPNVEWRPGPGLGSSLFMFREEGEEAPPPITLPKVYIGVDPGEGGGLAYVAGRRVEYSPMPRTERDIWEWFIAIEPHRRGTGRHVDSRGTGHAVDVFAVIERVHSFPEQGVASTFKFGRSYGFLRACLIAAEIPFDEINPEKWQRYFIPPRKEGEQRGAYKNRLKGKAQQLFPREKVTLATADALLLARYCQLKNEDKL